MKFCFHIGTGKAGSSSIQKFLADNTVTLEAHRSCYLGLNLEMKKNINSNPQSWQVVNGWPIWRSQPNRISSYIKAITEQAAELETQGYQQLIISNESIFGTYSDFGRIVEALKLAGHYVHVITILRRPHEWIRSAYLQWGIVDKNYLGSVPSFIEWGKHNLPAFAPELNRWYSSDKIDKIDIINLDSCNNLIQSFCELVSIRHSGCPDIRVNESRHPHELYLRWLLANHTPDKQSPILANNMLNQMSAISFNLDSNLTFSDLWPQGLSTEELDRLCDNQTLLLNETLKQAGSNTFPLSDQEAPTKGFATLESTNILACQNSIIALLLFSVSIMQQKIDRLEDGILRKVK